MGLLIFYPFSLFCYYSLRLQQCHAEIPQKLLYFPFPGSEEQKAGGFSRLLTTISKGQSGSKGAVQPQT